MAQPPRDPPVGLSAAAGREFVGGMLAALRGLHDGDDDLAGLASAVGASGIAVHRVVGSGRTRRFVVERAWPEPHDCDLDPVARDALLRRLDVTSAVISYPHDGAECSAFSIVCDENMVGFLSVRGTTIVPDSISDGLCRLMAGVFGLVEALRRADDGARGTRERFRRVIDNIPQLIFWKDRDSRYRGCNRNFAREVGIDAPDDVVGLSDADLGWSTVELRSARARDGEVMVDGEPSLHRVETHRSADGCTRILDVNLVPLHGRDGDVVGLLGALEDVTERSELEIRLRHAQKMEAVGRLAGGLAQDFDDLMATTLGHAESAAGHLPPDSPGRTNLDEIVREVSKTVNLTRQLLAFAHREVTEPSIVDVSSLIVDNERLFRRLIRADVLLNVSTARSPGSVRIDPGQLEQVLANLVINAADAMPEGGTLTIVAENHFQSAPPATDGVLTPGRYAKITVRDDGIGIPEDVVTRIFEPFFTTKTQDRGTGLGLSTAHGIIRHAGGDIRVSTTPGVGTSFTVLLPLAEGRETSVEGPARPELRRGEGESVLLVEDLDDLRSLYCEILGGMGYRVQVAANGVEALELVRRSGEPFDVLVTDLEMPVMGGARLSEIIGRESPTTTIIVMTGYAGDDGFGSASLPLSASILSKPFTVAQLAERVRDELSRKGRGGDGETSSSVD